MFSLYWYRLFAVIYLLWTVTTTVTDIYGSHYVYAGIQFSFFLLSLWFMWDAFVRKP